MCKGLEVEKAPKIPEAGSSMQLKRRLWLCGNEA